MEGQADSSGETMLCAATARLVLDHDDASARATLTGTTTCYVLAVVCWPFGGVEAPYPARNLLALLLPNLGFANSQSVTARRTN